MRSLIQVCTCVHRADRCSKGGMIEVSVQLPGSGSVSGLWPAVWTMGNLGRPGYGATTDGMWPYSYQECDVCAIE